MKERKAIDQRRMNAIKTLDLDEHFLEMAMDRARGLF